VDGKHVNFTYKSTINQTANDIPTCLENTMVKLLAYRLPRRVKDMRNGAAGKIAECMVRVAPSVGNGLNNAILISPHIEILFQ